MFYRDQPPSATDWGWSSETEGDALSIVYTNEEHHFKKKLLHCIHAAAKTVAVEFRVLSFADAKAAFISDLKNNIKITNVYLKLRSSILHPSIISRIKYTNSQLEYKCRNYGFSINLALKWLIAALSRLYQSILVTILNLRN